MMLYWIYDLPTPRLAGLFAVVFVGTSWFGALAFRPLLRRFVQTQLESTIDVVGYVLSCYCVFYGLLLGLIAVAAYENCAEVESAVTDEASVLAALYRDVSSYPDPDGENLRWLLRDYCRYVIKYAWPLQKRGIIPEGGTTRISAFQEKLYAFQPRTRAEELIHAETLRQFNHYVQLRRLRLFSVTTGIPKVLWYVLVLGSFINIALVWLLDMKLITHLFLGGLLAFFLSSVVFVIAVMDNPYRSNMGVSSEPFKMVFRSLMME
jgi:hypothetical protein